MSQSRLRFRTAACVLSLAGTLAVVGVPTAAQAKPDTDCQRAGMEALKGLGAFSAVARDGLPIATAVAVGVTPRAGTDVAALPDPLPLAVILADHRAGESSLFVYPWC